MTDAEESLKFAPSAAPRRDSILRAIATAVEDLGHRAGWDESLTFKVNLVLDELASNIISYGGEEGRRNPDIEIEIASGTDALVIEVSDDGRPFDPLNDAPPAAVIDGDTPTAPVGGLGLHLVKSMVDSLSYRHEDGRNRVILVARRKRPGQVVRVPVAQGSGAA